MKIFTKMYILFKYKKMVMWADETAFLLKDIFVEDILQARWIINNNGELGIRILGLNLWYYKWNTPIISYKDEYKSWRVIRKREFGEVIKPTEDVI